MRQRLHSHLTYANVMVTVLAFIVLGGGTALAAFVVSSNSQIAPHTIYGHKAPAGKNKNIVAGSVNGQDVAANSLTGANVLESSLTGNVRTLIYNANASPFPGPITPIATVGPYTLKGSCQTNNDPTSPNTVFSLYANGPQSAADWMYSQTRNDTSAGGTRSNGFFTTANTDTLILTVEDQLGTYTRAGGTAMLKTLGSPPVLVEVEFNAVALDSSPPRSCFLYGTATRAT
jgi:hypothetical protein